MYASFKTLSYSAVMTVSLRLLERLLSNGALQTTLILLFVLGISGYDSSLGLSDRCKHRCDKYRSRGWTGSYFFNCAAEHHNNPSDKDECENDCAQCPGTVCRSQFGEINFKCPKTQIPENCRDLCDKHRPKGNLDGYVLNCEEFYKDDAELRLCRNNCDYKECPEYMCQEKNASIVYCPTVELPKDSDCWKDCEKYREASDGDGAYTFQCSIKASHSPSEETECLKNCDTCPFFICANNTNKDKRYCPSIYSPRPLLTTPRTTPHSEQAYDGACKRRCDKYRFGGTAAYSFSCDTLFHSSQDISDCISDCLLCPSKICTFEDSSPTFHCPKSDNAEETHLPPQYLSPLCIFFLVLSLLFVLCFFSGGGLLLYKRRIHFEKKRREIKRRFSKRVSFQVDKLQVPKEEEPSTASSMSTFDLSPSVSQSESSLA